MLPVALILGALLHPWCVALRGMVPYLIFAILLLTFCAVDIRKLRMSWIDVWLMLFQVVVSCGGYVVLRLCGVGEVLSQAVLIGVLCPVASAVAVVSCMLGANRQTVTTYTIVDNLMVALVAPFVFTAIGVHPELSFLHSLWIIIRNISPTLALPLFFAWLLQRYWPKGNECLARYRGLAFYLWALALFFTLGQTIHYIVEHGDGVWQELAWMALAALVVCVLQFGVGRCIGRRYGDVISGGQLLGQKNTAMGIWMANTFLIPLSSVFLACYSIYQNVFNSWQLWRHDRRNSALNMEKK